MKKESVELLIKHQIPIIGDMSFRGDCPSETAEQISYFSELRSEHPDVADIACHIRNEGRRSTVEGYRHRMEGMNTGASDIFIPGNPSLLIELKKQDHTKSQISGAQIRYLSTAQQFGSMVCVALGSKAAMEATREWLKIINNI